MEAPNDVGSARYALGRLTRWWRTATEAQRHEALKASIRGDAQAPSLHAIHLAWLSVALEAEAARQRQRGSETPHGATAADA